MLHEFFRSMEEDLGRSGDGLSWSQQLHSSLNLWNLVEGTHVLTLMAFAGTIWLVDLRMMGLAFRDTPFSALNKRVLPITMLAFAVMLLTGAIAFFGRSPLMYYHDIWFRMKMLFLLAASLNIFWFHYRVQKDQPLWDGKANPPLKVKLSGAISLSAWLIIIIMGRFIAYDWYKCDKADPNSLVYALQECDSALDYLNSPAKGTNEESTPSVPAGGG